MKKIKSNFNKLSIEEILAPKEMKSIKGGACLFRCRESCKSGCSDGKDGSNTELLEQM